jgi:hypothetical protein
MKVVNNGISLLKPAYPTVNRKSNQPRFGESQQKPEPPLWESIDDKGIKASCTYNPKNGQYTVTVEKDEIRYQESFPALYEPKKFGMDVDDQAKMLEVAEKLAQKVEEKIG